MPYYHRVIERTVRKYLKLFPVVGLTGPRQSGKSTLLERILGAKYRYISFDDPNVVDRFHADPERFMEVYSDRVIFDEVQRVPDIFHYVKVIVDNNRSDCGKFIMTGSSQFAFMKRVSESLAGRIGLLTLLGPHASGSVAHVAGLAAVGSTEIASVMLRASRADR